MIIDARNRAQTEELASQYLELRKSGMAPHPESPAGAALLAAYNRQRAAQAAQALDTATKGAAIALRVTADERLRSKRKAAKKAAKKLRRAREAAAVVGPKAIDDRAQSKGEKAMRAAAASLSPTRSKTGFASTRPW